MAQEVEFKQAKLFGNNDPNVEALLDGIGTFSNNVSGVIEDLTVFFEQTKFLLEAISDPLAKLLIPAINALIASLEDLKNIGMGTLTVFPWEVGKIQSGVDTSKLEESIISLAAGLADVDPTKISYDPTTGTFVEKKTDSNPVDFNFSPTQILSGENAQKINSDKTGAIGALKSALDFLNPSSWDGPFDQAMATTIKTINESFKIPVLTPQQVINEIVRSFDDPNDPQKPAGGGQYVAFVLLFALPTHLALKDVTQAFVNFFQGVLGDEFLQGLARGIDDTEVRTITLGAPVVLSGIESKLDSSQEIQIKAAKAQLEALQQSSNEQFETLLQRTNQRRIGNTRYPQQKDKVEILRRRKSSIESEMRTLDNEISSLESRLSALPPNEPEKRADFERLLSEKITKRSIQSILHTKVSEESNSEEEILTKASALRDAQNININDSARNIDFYNRLIADEKKQKEKVESGNFNIAEKFYSYSDVEERKIPFNNVSRTFKGNSSNDFRPSQSFPFVSNPADASSGLSGSSRTVTIPMFKPGDLIVQGEVFNNFYAEVISHSEIVVKDGVILPHKVQVKKVRGEIVKKYGDHKFGSTDPIRKIGRVGSGSGTQSLGLFNVGEGVSAAQELLFHPMFYPTSADIPEEVVKATFRATITNNSITLTEVIPNTTLVTEIMSKHKTPFAKKRELYGQTVTGNKNLNDNKAYRQHFIDFAKTLIPGSIVEHSFIDTGDFEIAEVDNPFAKAAYALIPGLGLECVIKDVFIGSKKIKDLNENTIIDALFETETNSIDEITFVRINEISIELGRPTKQDNIQPITDFVVKVPNGQIRSIDSDIEAFRIKSAEYSNATGLPDWKFVRIQDMFPVYAETIDEIIGFLQLGKDFATQALTSLNTIIEFFERLLKQLKTLNETIQNTLAFFANGLDKAGLYSASFSGQGGVPEFKQSLQEATIKAKTSGFPEFELRPVEIEREITDPVTGETNTIKTSTLKTIQVENDTPSEVQLSWKDLESLQYSGALVFYAQGNNINAFKQFLSVSGIGGEDKRSKSDISDDAISEGETITVTLDDGTNVVFENLTLEKFSEITNKLNSFVDKIFVEKDQVGNFVLADGQTEVLRGTRIRVKFANRADQLTAAERALIKFKLGEDVDFTGQINNGSLFASGTTTVSGSFQLSSDEFETMIPVNFNSELVPESNSVVKNTEFIMTPLEDLPSKTTFKVKILRTVTQTDGDFIDEPNNFIMTTGFTTTSTKLVDVDFINVQETETDELVSLRGRVR